jgi:hypothetical protein
MSRPGTPSKTSSTAAGGATLTPASDPARPSWNNPRKSAPNSPPSDLTTARLDRIELVVRCGNLHCDLLRVSRLAREK